MIAIIQYNAGNTGSVVHALRRLGYESIITDDPDLIRTADKVILPGVGEAGSAMEQLSIKGLTDVIPTLTQPVLGICLGLQIMCRHSEEGDTQGMGIFDADVKRFPKGSIIPHMGWNNIQDMQGALFQSLNTLSVDMYFVHSYYAPLCAETIGQCNYLLPFSAAMRKNNFYATQFHPEKSGVQGEVLLKNFLNL